MKPESTHTTPAETTDRSEALKGLETAIDVAEAAAKHYAQNAQYAEQPIVAEAWNNLQKRSLTTREQLITAKRLLEGPNVKAEAHPWFSRMELVRWIANVERTLGTKCLKSEVSGFRGDEVINRAVFRLAQPIDWSAFATATIGVDGQKLKPDGTLEVTICVCKPKGQHTEPQKWDPRDRLARWIGRVEGEFGTQALRIDCLHDKNDVCHFNVLFKGEITTANLWHEVYPEIDVEREERHTYGDGNGRLQPATMVKLVVIRQPTNITPFPVTGPKDEKRVSQLFDRAFGGSTPTPEAADLAGNMSAHLQWASERLADEAEHLERLAAAAVDCGARADMIRAKIDALLATAAQLLRAAGVIDAMDHPSKALPNCRAMAIAQVLRWIWVPSSGYQLEAYEWLTDYRIEGTELKKVDVVANP